MHLWSLGIEEQFYLTYPFLLWAVWRLRGNLLAIIVPLVLISFSLNAWQVRTDAASSFFLPQTRFWELWMGGALAYLDIFRPDVGRRVTRSWANLVPRVPVQKQISSSAAIVPNTLSTVGMVLIAISLLRVRESAFPGWWALLPVCGASLLIVAGPAAWINRTILSNRVAVFVGLISYPLYLWHWPILSFASIILQDDLSRGMRTAAVCLSFLLAWATWRFVESPIRFGRKIWIKTAALAAISVMIACVGYTIHAQNGFVSRFKNVPVDLSWLQKPEIPSSKDCLQALGTDHMGFCRLAGKGPPDVVPGRRFCGRSPEHRFTAVLYRKGHSSVYRLARVELQSKILSSATGCPFLARPYALRSAAIRSGRAQSCLSRRHFQDETGVQRAEGVRSVPLSV